MKKLIGLATLLCAMFAFVSCGATYYYKDVISSNHAAEITSFVLYS